MELKTYRCDYTIENENFFIEVTGDILFYVRVEEQNKKILFLTEALDNLIDDSVLNDFYLKLQTIQNNELAENIMFSLKDNGEFSPLVKFNKITSSNLRYQKGQQYGRPQAKFESVLEVN